MKKLLIFALFMVAGCSENTYEMGKDARYCDAESWDHRYCDKDGKLITGLVVKNEEVDKVVYTVEDGYIRHTTRYVGDVKQEEYDNIVVDDGTKMIMDGKTYVSLNGASRIVNQKTYYKDGKLLSEVFGYDFAYPSPDNQRFEYTTNYDFDGNVYFYSIRDSEKELTTSYYYDTNMGLIIEYTHFPFTISKEASNFVDENGKELDGDVEIYGADGKVWQKFGVVSGSPYGERNVDGILYEYDLGKLVKTVHNNTRGGAWAEDCGEVRFDKYESFLVGNEDIGVYYNGGKKVLVRCGDGKGYCGKKLSAAKTAEEICK